jgi:hypothetical protein
MKILFTILIFFFSQNLFSQTDSTTLKGRLFVTGSIGVQESLFKFTGNNGGREDRKNTTTNFSLSIGSFSKNNVANIFTFGIRGYSNTPETSLVEGYSLGYVREYYKMFSKKFGVFGGVGLDVYSQSITNFNERTTFSSSTSENITLFETDKRLYRSVYIDASPGLIYFLNPKWAFSIQVGSLNLISINFQKVESSKDYLTNNDEILTFLNNETGTFYSFNPYISLGNSAIGIRYHFK